jgi:hypothetical protein
MSVPSAVTSSMPPVAFYVTRVTST